MLKIELTEKERIFTEGHTSKGNQPKWRINEHWYKADHMGYEGLSEVLVSRLLAHSGFQNYVSYEPVQICEGDRTYPGSRSCNFQQKDEMLVPLERLYRAYYGSSLAKKLAEFDETEERIRFTANFVEEKTGIADYGTYLSILIELDALTLNEDRHTNNIAVLRNEKTGKFRICPVFDNGLSFLSDMRDYPLSEDIYKSIAKAEAKPFSRDFLAQLEAAMKLYGDHLHFNLSRKETDVLFAGMDDYYPEEILNRVRGILSEQIRKLPFLFTR